MWHLLPGRLEQTDRSVKGEKGKGEKREEGGAVLDLELITTESFTPNKTRNVNTGFKLSSLLIGAIIQGLPPCLTGSDLFLAVMLETGKHSMEPDSGMMSWCRGE